MAIHSFGLPYPSYQLYDVYFNGNTIKTLVTTNPCIIATWIADIHRIHQIRGRNVLIVGLNIISNYNDNRPATLQLWPVLLTQFLNTHIFFGVGIADDKEKLARDFLVQVTNTMDLRDVAVRAGHEGLRLAGLRTVVEEVLLIDFERPQEITLSDWEADWLSLHQIEYACRDAHALFQVWRSLMNIN